MIGDYAKKYKYLRDHIKEIKSEVFDVQKKQVDLKNTFKKSLEEYKVKKLLGSISDKK